MHAQLVILAQVESTTITDAIRTAIEAHVARLSSSPELNAKAEAMLADIEQEMLSRKQAITAMLKGSTDSTAPAPVLSPSGGRGRRKTE